MPFQTAGTDGPVCFIAPPHILARMIDYLENRGPQKVSRSKSPPLVSSRVRAGLAGHEWLPS